MGVFLQRLLHCASTVAEAAESKWLGQAVDRIAAKSRTSTGAVALLEMKKTHGSQVRDAPHWRPRGARQIDAGILHIFISSMLLSTPAARKEFINLASMCAYKWQA
jgi:hypothetical protein